MVATVVVVQMRDDDVLDRVCLYADGFQSLCDGPDDGPAPLARHRFVESGVHDERPVPADDGPHEVRERLEDVVWIAEQIVLGRLPVVVRVPHRKDFVNVIHHRSVLLNFPTYSLTFNFAL